MDDLHTMWFEPLVSNKRDVEFVDIAVLDFCYAFDSKSITNVHIIHINIVARC